MAGHWEGVQVCVMLGSSGRICIHHASWHSVSMPPWDKGQQQKSTEDSDLVVGLRPSRSVSPSGVFQEAISLSSFDAWEKMRKLNGNFRPSGKSANSTCTIQLHQTEWNFMKLKGSTFPVLCQVRMVPKAGDVVLLVDENGRMVLPSGHFCPSVWQVMPQDATLLPGNFVVTTWSLLRWRHVLDLDINEVKRLKDIVFEARTSGVSP